MADTVKVAQIKTKAMTHVVVRNLEGHKLFDMDIRGVAISVTTPSDAEISIFDPDRGKGFTRLERS